MYQSYYCSNMYEMWVTKCLCNKPCDKFDYPCPNICDRDDTEKCIIRGKPK